MRPVHQPSLALAREALGTKNVEEAVARAIDAAYERGHDTGYRLGINHAVRKFENRVPPSPQMTRAANDVRALAS